MIKVKNGKVKVKGYSHIIIAEFMTLMLCLAENFISDTFGRENVKEELLKIVDEVCERFYEESEEQ